MREYVAGVLDRWVERDVAATSMIYPGSTFGGWRVLIDNLGGGVCN